MSATSPWKNRGSVHRLILYSDYYCEGVIAIYCLSILDSESQYRGMHETDLITSLLTNRGGPGGSRGIVSNLLISYWWSAGSNHLLSCMHMTDSTPDTFRLMIYYNYPRKDKTIYKRDKCNGNYSLRGEWWTWMILRNWEL